MRQITRRKVNVDDVLQPLADMPIQAYMSNVLQVADVLEWIVKQIGKADVCMTSFSIAEEFLRRIFFMRQEDLIGTMTLMLDFKATNKTLKLFPFIAQTIEDCHLADNHSKIMLISNDNNKVVVVMSQNLTRGNRYESGVVIKDNVQYDLLKEQFDIVLNNQSVPFNDIFARTIDKDRGAGDVIHEAD
jgi:hypothetical protein